MISLYSTRKEAELEVFKYIEMFYNPIRLHESLDHISPLDSERKYEQNLVGNFLILCFVGGHATPFRFLLLEGI
ncbi:MAG: IS3 family transposase [Candidatus Sabulitectum sp.]|nr:IS3 family transposase [Candidatus Sabulitectum sp.]